MDHRVYKTSYELSDDERLYFAEPGVVYTRTWAVNLILDLAGYDPTLDLVDCVAVEPSCGNGEFLEAMVWRLAYSCQRRGRTLRECKSSLMAFDLSFESVETSRRRVKSVLINFGWSEEESENMARCWVRQADFLLDADLDLTLLGGGVDFVVGNPPYVRLEFTDQATMELYRKRYKTMGGRADLYVGFYERALQMLASDGVCVFICADRWMLNQYGSRLRNFITSEGYSVEAVIEMYKADAFQSKVLAYPAITVIRRSEKQGKVFVAKMDQSLQNFALEMPNVMRDIRRGTQTVTDDSVTVSGGKYVVVDEWFRGPDPWPSASPERLKLLKKLEEEFPTLEDDATGTKVGIGVATGADGVFLTKDGDLVEEDRLLPMVMAKDTTTGAIEWTGTYLVNPWKVDGSLVNLELYPLLRSYFETNKESLAERHVARKNPSSWYKTIDKVDHELTAKTKLLIPDIKGFAHPVLDDGDFHPHHNLYYVTSEAWDLRVLGGILLSRVCQFFVECYAVRMHSGYLRFQAQYLRRVRVPDPESISSEQAEGLIRAFESRDVKSATDLTLELYRIEKIPD